MKVAVTSSGKTLDSPVDPRFGRAAYFLIVDTDSLEFEVVDNTDNINAFKGAGIQAAVRVALLCIAEQHVRDGRDRQRLAQADFSYVPGGRIGEGRTGPLSQLALRRDAILR